MKKNLFYAATLLLAASFTGCSNEEGDILKSENFSVVAGIGSQSRTALAADDETVVWSAGDQIYLFGGNSNATMTLVSGAGDTEGTFSGPVNGYPSELTQALYPVPQMDGDVYTYEFPSEITYSENSNAPMLGNLSNGNITFSNLVPLVRIPLTNLDATRANTLILTIEGITGTATVDLENRSLTFPQTGMGNMVKVTIPQGVANCNVDIPVPEGTYQGFEIKLNGNVIASQADALTLDADAVAITTLGVIEGEDGETEITPEEDGTYRIDDVAELIQFAQTVNKGGEDNDFEGVTVTLANDIDLAGINWTPIGASGCFRGTFDGAGKTISNLKVETEGNASAGLFASSLGTIKGVNLVNVDIKGHYKTGAIVGDGICSKIEDCHVIGGTIISTPYNKDDANHVGGIVGYLSAEPDAYVKNCSVDGLQITAYRDVAGIAGTANGDNPTIENNEVSNTIIVADQTVEYVAAKAANAGAIVGRIETSAALSGNSENNVTVKTLVATADQLTNAIKKANDGQTIVFANDIVGEATAVQNADVDVVIDGNGYKYNGTIYIHGKARFNGAETLTIQNVNFVADAECDFISCNTTAPDERYAHNVTVKDCTFTGTGNEDVVGMRYRQCYNMKVLDCTAVGMHSLLWATGCTGFEIDGAILDNSKNGVSFGTSTGCVVKNSNLVSYAAYGYGIRVDASGAYTLEVSNSVLTADAPILLRKATGNYALTLVGQNSLNAMGNYQIIATSGDYEEGKELTEATGNIAITGAEGMTIF